MASCSNCTRTLPEGVAVCPFCGKKIRADLQASQTDYLYPLRRNLRTEKTCWRVNGMLLVAVFVIALAAGAWAVLRGNLPNLIVSILVAVWCIPAVVINFRQFLQMEDFIDGIYIDCGPAVERSEKIPPLLLAFFFNWIAFPFVFGNFKYAKKYQGTLDRIRRDQDLRYEREFNNDRFHSLQ